MLRFSTEQCSFLYTPIQYQSQTTYSVQSDCVLQHYIQQKLTDVENPNIDKQETKQCNKYKLSESQELQKQRD